MRRWGPDLEGVELGNAWALRSPDTPHTNWVVGDHPGIPEHSLRFLCHGGQARDAQLVDQLALKWFVHSPADPPEWGERKPISSGCTLSLLAGEGAFELVFCRGAQELVVRLDTPGDFALWGPGVEHSWRPLEPSLVLTLRWQVQGDLRSRRGSSS